ncbi:glycosyltransferase [Actinomadura sp. J1-007]|nr:glycosyltransferase [Actinomadura sp. J1-007]
MIRMSPAPSSGPRVAVVVATVGRPRLLDRLLLSLAGQTLPPADVVVVDRDPGPGTRVVVAERAALLPVRRLALPAGTRPGLSAARNAGLAALDLAATSASASAGAALAARDGADEPSGTSGTGGTAVIERDGPGIVVFADDDIWYQPDAFARAARAIGAGPDVVAGRLLASGRRPATAPIEDEPGPLDARTVWTHAPTGTCFFRAAFLAEVGGFDESLGIGCAAPWQSGAGPDLLLRGLRAGRELASDPDVRAYGHNPEDRGASDRGHRAKARHAARGAGRVHRRHCGAYACARAVVRPLAAVAVHTACGRWPMALRSLHVAVGRAEGMSGLLLPAPRPVPPQHL